MQVRRLNEAFAEAIAESGYANDFRGVYPIKVNQLHEVVDEVLDAGREFGLGLECGSKAELVAGYAGFDLPDGTIAPVDNGQAVATPAFRAIADRTRTEVERRLRSIGLDFSEPDLKLDFADSWQDELAPTSNRGRSAMEELPL